MPPKTEQGVTMNNQQQTGLFKFLISELKPKGKILTPFNVIAAITILVAAGILFIRFKNGLGSVIHASQETPWGLWINFNVITGVAFAGGAFVVTFMVYILGLEKYRPIVRPTVLYALLAYMFYAGALLLDLGRPWKVINPIIGNSFGISSVLFLVAWHFILYMGALFIEFSPTIAEWTGRIKIRKFLVSLTLGVVIFGIALSTLHQSGLGALFLMAKSKIHPLWYSEFIPILFFISSIFAGLSLVIIIETMSQRIFRNNMSFANKASHRKIVISLAKVCSITMFVYFSMLVLVFLHGKNQMYINTPWGYWYLVEVIGFVLIPCLMFLYSYRKLNLSIVRIAAVISIVGIVLNRLNISTFSFKWYENTIHFPSWMEIVVSAAVIFVQILVFRWIIRRMPVYNEAQVGLTEEKNNKSIRVYTKSEEKWKILVE